MKKTLLIATALMTWALSPSAAQETSTSSILQSLPAEVQKSIEDIRAGCRAYWNDRGIADSGDALRFLVPSGGEGLIPFTLSGAQAVMVSNLNLCGGQCLKGVVCYTTGFYDINVYVRSGQAWRNVLSTEVDNVFLSLGRDRTAFKAMVLGISAGSKDCPKRLRAWWKLPRAT